MKQDDVAATLSGIRSIMENSTRLMSLNGTASIFVGVYALLAAFVAYFLMGADSSGMFLSSLEVCTPSKYRVLLLIAFALIVVSVATVIALSLRRSKRIAQPLRFNKLALRAIWNFFMPLLVGAALCLIFYSQGLWGLSSSIMLIFYGFALVNTSNYTHSDSKYLGYAQILLGVIDAAVVNHALLFWIIGFGVFHIIYGIWFTIKK